MKSDVQQRYGLGSDDSSRIHRHFGLKPDFTIVIYLYEPSDGGLDRVAILLANTLLKRGVKVELWLGHVAGPLADLVDPELTVRRIPTPRWHRRLATLIQFPLLTAMIRRHRPDIIYSAGIQSNRVVGLAALGTGSRAVGRISNPIVKPGRSGAAAWARTLRFRALARISAMTIVMGEADRRTLAAEGPLAGTRITLLPRPTITPVIEMARAARRPRDKNPPWQTLMVGRLARQKGQSTALAALAGITDVAWRLKIAGQGPLLDTLKAECQQLGIADRVEFLGFVGDPEQLAALMADADLLLHPSRWEGFSGVVIEALGCGMNVVATDCTPNIHPLLCAARQHSPTPIDDVAAFRAAIRWALDHPAPPKCMAQAVAPYHVDRAIDAHLEVFKALMHR
jgi:glycosyltransferase involved in cell wall biosynthesis